MVDLTVNGIKKQYSGDPTMPLMWYLRDELSLTGTKYGCGVALCGACTVHLNGEAVRACGVPMSDLEGKTVVTIEGLDQQRQSPGAGRVAQSRRAAMRLLPGRADHAGGGAPEAEARADRQGHHRRDVRQPVPLRLLPAHSCGRPRRREGSMTMNYHRTHEIPVITNVSRRGLLKGVAAGGLVLAAQFPAVRDALGYPTGADKMPNGTVSDPHIFVSIAAERPRHHRGGARRDGHRRGAHHACR